MPIDSTRYQQITLSKEQIDRVKKLSKKCRYPMTRIISHAIELLINDPKRVEFLMKGGLDQ